MLTAHHTHCPITGNPAYLIYRGQRTQQSTILKAAITHRMGRFLGAADG